MIAKIIYKGFFIEISINKQIISQEYKESNYKVVTLQK